MNAFFLLGLLSLAVYRCTRLLTKDTFPPVLWLRDQMCGGWRPLTEKETYTFVLPSLDEGEMLRTKGLGHVRNIDGVTSRYVIPAEWVPYWLSELLSCPWCASGWIAGALTAGTDIVIGVPVPVLFGFAAWALGALLASQEWA